MDIVTGATGHLGNALVRALLIKGRGVRVLVRRSSDLYCFEDLDIEIVYGDLLDKRTLAAAFATIDTVYHAAGLVSFGIVDTDDLYAVNVRGTANVIDACLECKARRLVYISSIEALDLAGSSRPITESGGFRPDYTIMKYGKSKAQASLDVLRAVEQRGLDAVIACPTGFVGPYDFKISSIGKLFIDYVHRRLPVIIGGGFDFVDIRDVADGLLAANQHGKKGEFYILSGHFRSVSDFIRVIREATGISFPSIKLPHWLALFFSFFAEIYYKVRNSPPRFTRNSVRILALDVQVSSEKAGRELGYSARPFQQTVRETIEWLRQEGYL